LTIRITELTKEADGGVSLEETERALVTLFTLGINQLQDFALVKVAIELPKLLALVGQRLLLGPIEDSLDDLRGHDHLQGLLANLKLRAELFGLGDHLFFCLR